MYMYLNNGLAMSNPNFDVFEQQRCSPAFTFVQSDEQLCLVNTIPKLASCKISRLVSVAEQVS